MGKSGTEWGKGRSCLHCKSFENKVKDMKMSNSIGICKKFNIEVTDCLCGCRTEENTSDKCLICGLKLQPMYRFCPGCGQKLNRNNVILMNFGNGILDKITVPEGMTIGNGKG